MSATQADSFSLTIVGDEKDWLSASWLLTRDQWLWKRLLIVSALIWVVYAALMIVPAGLQYGWHPSWIEAGLVRGSACALGVILFGVALACGVMPSRVRKLFLASAKLARTTRFSFDALGISSVNEHTSTRLDWGQFERWLENDRILLLIVMQRSYFILPKSQIAPETLDALRAQLIAARVPHR